MEDKFERYSRQVLFPPIGESGQESLSKATVGLVGLGALGSTIAESLVRGGIGRLIAVDRDIIESSNLHRQGLYQEEDAQSKLPKAEAARKRLQTMNSQVTVETHVLDFRANCAEDLFSDCQILIDGTDSFETRYLINDLSIRLGIPWIYGACVGATGMTATIIPQETPCLACLFPDPPPPGSGETCDTAGIIAPAAQIVAALQVTEALKILVGDTDSLRTGLLSFELWPFRLIEIGTKNPKPNASCPACSKKELRFLDGEHETEGIVLCGRDSVQIRPSSVARMDFADIEDRWKTQGTVEGNGLVLTLTAEELTMTLFRDGRALIKGTTDPARARQFYARYVGS